MGSTIDTLINRVADEQLRTELRVAVADLRKTTDFGLVFEAHLPETVRLPHHAVRRGIKVAYRAKTDQSVYRVVRVDGATATIQRMRNSNGTALSPQERAATGGETANVAELVALAEFGDPVYPGLRHVGSVSRGGDKAAHVVINGENHHALEALKFSHAGKIDCIYIDPPYNTGARDWKYNNRYVDQNDQFRHSKWLSFMARRLEIAKHLLRPDGSVLLITIDDTEVYSLGLLLDQLFPGYERQMVSITISPRGKSRTGRLSQTDEYLLVVYVGSAAVSDRIGGDGDMEVRWRYLRREDVESARETRPRQFYPIYVDPRTRRIVKIGAPLAPGDPLDTTPLIGGAVPVYPIREDGLHMNWGLTGRSLQRTLDQGYVRVTPGSHPQQPFTIAYLTAQNIEKVKSGEYEVRGTRPDGSPIVVAPGGKARRPTTAWREARHDAGAYGTSLIGALLPGRKFPFPKSLYAVEDTLRLFVHDKPDAVILDFFAGSGTTAHAVARLNRQDGGRRMSISVTNNEVGEDEARALRARGLSPGDAEWEAQGIFEHITRPRIAAAITGRTPDDQPVAGSYTYTDEFPMGEGFSENAEFFELTYLDAAAVDARLAFAGIAPLLWLRAGATGAVIQECADRNGAPKPFEWTTRYGALFDTDAWRPFVASHPDTATTAFIVTNSYTEFAHIAGELPGHLDVVRLYERYLATFAVYGR